VLVNLLGNAVKFTQSGEVAIGVRSRALGGGRCEILFAVKDTGIGIPEDKLGVLFQSFSQVDASTTKLYGGTGLGLAISKRLTELMGGKISVESYPGIGSTFQFAIPVEVSPAHRFESQDQICAVLVQKRVLIVDDNETSRELLSRQANLWGMLAETAQGGREALERIDGGEKFDCIILDMGMPGMDGAALTEALRRRADWQQKPLVVLLSGTASKQNLGDRKANDVRVSYVSKPTRAPHLKHALVELFSDQTLVEPLTAAAIEPAKSSEEKMRLRVLLAEDNLVNQKVALRMLSRIGYKADVAANGLEALEALSRQPYDVVLMDMQMPQMDGLETTRQIHQRWGKEGRPWIIAMTANAMEGDREMCLRAGMDDYISKPVKLADLETALKQAESYVLGIKVASSGEGEKVASSE
jgi:CheY-like chemotaxis protein